MRRSSLDDVIDVYKRDVDRTLLRRNLGLTVEERITQAQQLLEAAEAMRRGARAATAAAANRPATSSDASR